MHSDLDTILDDLLARWHVYSRQYQVSKGFAPSSATCRDFRAPGHYDWANGATEAREEKIIMQGVDEAIGRIPNDPQPWRTMIEFEARNLAVGVSVWTSPRLPKDKEEFALLRLEARNRAMRELHRQGAMT